MQIVKLRNILSDWHYQLLPAMSAPPQQRCLGNILTKLHLQQALTKVCLEQKHLQSKSGLLI